MKNTEAVQAFLALGQETRLNVFRLIVQKGDTGIRPSQLGELLGVPPATLSFHLKELFQANLITVERQSRNLIYRPKAEMVEGLMEPSCKYEGLYLGRLPFYFFPSLWVISTKVPFGTNLYEC